jgi:hypothetical protein
VPGGPKPSGSGGGNRAVLFIVLGVVLVLVLCAGACVAGYAFLRDTADSVERAVAEATSAPTRTPRATEPSPSDRQPLLPPGSGEPATVVYEVTGDGPASITYVDESGLPTQALNVELPWRTEVTMRNRAFIMLIALRSEAGDGAIGCRLTIDGREVAKTDASGGFATVDCTSIGGN